jgi:hypothetical protein
MLPAVDDVNSSHYDVWSCMGNEGMASVRVSNDLRESKRVKIFFYFNVQRSHC